MMKKLIFILAFAGLTAFGQLTTTQTNFTAAVPLTGPGTSGFTTVALASCTSTVLPSTAAVGSYLWADWEAMQITSLVSGSIGGSGACTINVKRGQLGTKQGAHGTTAVVYVGNQAQGTGDNSRPFSGGAFALADPQGTCTASLQFTLPIIATLTGRVWNCPTTGPLAGNWAVTYDPTAVFSITDGALFLGPGNCTVSASANGTGTAGLQTVGGVAVNQQAVTNIGTNTITFTCHLAIPTRLRGSATGPGAGAAILDVVAPYGVQQAALGTQAAVVASGTFNGTTVFQKITLPTPAAGETQSAAASRADTGSIVITPVAGSFNVGTTTAGQFFTAKFAPATPIIMNADLTDFIFNITFQCAATTATTINMPGLFVHLIGVPL